jgi:hypothetical protein
MPDPREVRISALGLQRPCVCCQVKFRPHPRLGLRQKTCGAASCRKRYRARYQHQYRQVPEHEKIEHDYEVERKKQRPPDFWKTYRDAHPEATQRNRANSRLKKRLTRDGLQRKLDIVQLFVPIDQSESLIRFATKHRSLLEKCARKTAA